MVERSREEQRRGDNMNDELEKLKEEKRKQDKRNFILSIAIGFLAGVIVGMMGMSLWGMIL